MRMLSTKIGAPSEIGRDWHIILVSAIGCGLGYAALVFYTSVYSLIRLEQNWLEPSEVSRYFRSLLLACLPLVQSLAG